jgi:hypothetical protein
LSIYDELGQVKNNYKVVITPQLSLGCDDSWAVMNWVRYDIIFEVGGHTQWDVMIAIIRSIMTTGNLKVVYVVSCILWAIYVANHVSFLNHPVK